jgi:hypothetical protein
MSVLPDTSPLISKKAILLLTMLQPNLAVKVTTKITKMKKVQHRLWIKTT